VCRVVAPICWVNVRIEPRHSGCFCDVNRSHLAVNQMFASDGFLANV
jgi:hypothetical protein